MLSQRTWLYLGLAVVAGGGALLVGRGEPSAEALGSGCTLDGTWVGVSPNGSIFMETFSSSRDGMRSQFVVRSTTGPALAALFPDARSSGTGLRGEAVRVSPNTWRFKGIAYVVTDNPAGGVDLTYIRVDEGTTVLTDCDTQTAVNNVSFYLPEQDADGDGFPDEGEEPFIYSPGNMPSIQRLRG